MDEASKVLKFIGIKKSKPTALWIVAQDGISKQAIKTLIKNTKFPASHLCKYIGVSARSLNSKSPSSKVSICVSDRALDLAELYVYGISALDSLDNFNQWLETSLLTLGGKKPIDLMQSSHGVKIVFQLVMNIEYGMFA